MEGSAARASVVFIEMLEGRAVAHEVMAVQRELTLARNGADLEIRVGKLANSTLERPNLSPICSHPMLKGYSDLKFAIQLKKKLEKHGNKSIVSSYKSIKQLLEEHKQKLPNIEYKSSVE